MKTILAISLFILLFLIRSFSEDKKDAPRCVENISTIDTIYSDFVIECKRREGFRSESYTCPAGKKTIGYGQTHSKLDNITKKEATADLHNTLDAIYAEAKRELPKHSRNQHLAVTLLVYNIGWNKLKSYKLWEKIKRKEAVYSYWISISYYRNAETRKMQRSVNLYNSRKFEIWLYESNYMPVKQRTKETLNNFKNSI